MMEHRLRVTGTVVAVVMVLTACSSPREPSPATPPAAAPTGSIWVADESGNSLSVIDAATHSVATTLTGIAGPHNVQVGPGGTVVYATSGAGLVVAIDPTTYRVIASAPTGPHPAHVVEAPNGKVYVTNTGDGTESVYQKKGLVPAGRITLGGMPHGLRPAAGGSVIVVANMMDAALDLIDPATDTSLGSVAVGTSPLQVAVSADGRYAYTGLSDPPSVVKVDLSTRTVIGHVPVPNSPVQLSLSPDEKTVLSADQGSKAAPGNTLSVIDTTTMTARATIPTGSGPHGVVIDPSGHWAWVTNSFDNTVATIDLTALAVAATTTVGNGPNGISYATAPPAPAPAPTNSLTITAPPTAEGSAQTPHSEHGH